MARQILNLSPLFCPSHENVVFAPWIGQKRAHGFEPMKDKASSIQVSRLSTFAR